MLAKEKRIVIALPVEGVSRGQMSERRSRKWVWTSYLSSSNVDSDTNRVENKSFTWACWRYIRERSWGHVGAKSASIWRCLNSTSDWCDLSTYPAKHEGGIERQTCSSYTRGLSLKQKGEAGDSESFTVNRAVNSIPKDRRHENCWW